MRRRRKFSLGAALGLALTLAGLMGLYSGPEISQYVYMPGTEEPAEGLASVEEKFADAFAAVSLHGVTEQASLTAGTRSQGEITLYQVAGGYFEIYPRAFTAGRPLNRGDGTDPVIVLDSDLAFQLFRDQDPLGKTVSLEGKDYQVVGVAAHHRRMGENGTYAAWIPLGVKDAPGAVVRVLSAGGSAGSALRTVFENGAKEVFGTAGQAYFLGKERTRGTVILRFVLIVIAICLLAAWIRLISRWFREWIARLRARLQTCYPRQMIGALAGRSLLILALSVLTIAAGAGLVIWASQLMMVFPEWVPEVLVDPDSIAQRFWDLTTLAASPLQFRTPELAEIRFWSGLLRWGVVIFLLGAALAGWRNRWKTRTEKE